MVVMQQQRVRRRRSKSSFRIKKMAREIAEAKERIRLMRVRVENSTHHARKRKQDLQAMHVQALSIEDPNERSKMVAQLHDSDKELDDLMFHLAERRSETRRLLRLSEICEERLVAMRKSRTASS